MSEDQTTTAENTETPVAAQQPSARRTRAIWTAITVLGVLALVLGGAFGWRVAANRLAGAAKIDRAQSLIESADKTVVAIDKVVVAEVTLANAKRAEELTPGIAPAQGKLEEALRLLDQARPTATEDEQRRAGLLSDSANGRLAMLKQVQPILDATVKAARAKDLAERGWERVNQGETESDSAVAQFNKLTKAAAQQSAKYDAQAQESFLAGKDLMAQAETAFPDADFEPLAAYIDSKLAEVALSQQATAAYLKGDAKRANQLADAFNTEDKRLVEVAKGLPQSIGDIVGKAYERTAAAATNAYFSAREATTKADDKLRRF